MGKEIIAIGPAVRLKDKYVTGQSMMFQLLVDKLLAENRKVKVIDIGKIFSSNKNRVTGSFSLVRALDYLVISAKAFFAFISSPKQVLYFTTAQSTAGFIRDFIVIHLALACRYKIICHYFGSNYSAFYHGQKSFVKQMIKRTLDRVDAIIVESDFTKQQLTFLDNYNEKVISILNGLPEKKLQISGKGKQLSKDEPFQMFYLSNMIISKGYWDVVKALHILINEYKLDVDCTFAGSFIAITDDPPGVTPRDSEIAFFKYIEDNNLAKYITYHKGLFGEEKAEAFKKANVFLLPTYYVNEGQPVSILEAMAYSTVPIVTEYRIIPSMVNEQTGFFVPPKDPEAIAKAIKYLIINPEMYHQYSVASYKHYESSFTAEVYLNKLIGLIDQP